MKFSTKENYSIEDFVFFRMKGYPWWPGFINDIENLPKKKIYYIWDPYTDTISKINDIKNIINFEENIEPIAKNAKGKKYINSIIFGIEIFFQGKKMPKKYEKILKDLKEGNINNNLNNSDKNKENKNNVNNKEYDKINTNKKVIKELKDIKDNKRIVKKEKEKVKDLLNKKRKPPVKNYDDFNQKKDNKKIE